MDIALDEMEDVTGKGSEVGDQSNIPFDFDAASDSSSPSESSFSGFSRETFPETIKLAPPPKAKNSASSSLGTPQEKKSKRGNSSASSHKRKGDKPPRSDSSKSQPEASSSRPQPTPAPAPAVAPDLSAITASILAALQPHLTGLQTSMMSEIAQVRTDMSQVRSDVSTVRSEVSTVRSDMSTMETSLRTEVSSVAAQVRDLPSLDPARMAMPSVDSLPAFDPQNPWRSAAFAPLAGGMLTIEGIGTRPISDFERFPPEKELPFCYVRLSEEASIREDRVPKETILYPKDRAQNCLMQAMKDAGCSNSRIVPFKGSLTMFSTSGEMPNPFTSKVLEAVNQAVLEDKTSVSLKEDEATSLLFPGDSPAWEEVVPTFSSGRLTQDCASVQFNEDLPKLPEAMLKAEFEARSRLARTLHHCTVLELAIFRHPDVELLKVLAKSMVGSLSQDLMSFAVARRNCRKHVFQNAQVRHEPTKLINGPIWGASLFPSDLVQEAIAGATQANASLRARWRMPFKRKSQDSSGPQPKNQNWKKQKGNPHFKIPKVPQPQSSYHQSYMVPVSSDQTVQGPQGQQYVVLTPQQSPAFNQAYERQRSFRPKGFFDQLRGGRGAFNRGNTGVQQRGRGKGQYNKGKGSGRGAGAGRGAEGN